MMKLICASELCGRYATPGSKWCASHSTAQPTQKCISTSCLNPVAMGSNQCEDCANKSVMSKSLADEAFGLVNGGRQDSYGKSKRSFEAVADVWTGLLKNKLAEGQRVTAIDVALLMIGLKAARETNQRKRDNLVDLHGYTFLAGDLAGYK